MRVGYVRVSTAEQNPARQVELMKSLDVEKVFLDKISGKNTDRPQFNEMLWRYPVCGVILKALP